MSAADINLHRMRRFAMAADYMRTNGFTTPLFSFAIAGILWQWFPAWQVFGWAAVASCAQIVMGLVAHLALRDRENAARHKLWRARVMAATLPAGVIFGGAILLFYLPGERLNNILLIAVAVGSVATLAAMTSSDRGVMIVTTAPFVLLLCLVMALYEAYPFNAILTAIAILYSVETFVTANKLSGMVGRMIDLQIGNDRLYASLAEEKRESDQARIRAENASRAKSNFLANMSHELRTPLNAILGFSEVIRDRVFGDNASARYTGYAADIHNSGSHLLSLINDILDLSRIEAGKWELQEESVELAGLFDEVLKLHAQQAAKKGVRLTAEAAVGTRLFADRKAIAQILVNLVTNAVKFTPEGGTVSITSDSKDGALVLAVRDTGIGIAAADLPRVMERFGQARHDVAASAQIGVGLGLAIVKGLAEVHGAALSLESEPGKGTCVSVRFPAARAMPPRAEAA